MKSTRLIGAVSIGCGVALVLAGTALASDVSLDTTGPQSIQDVKLKNLNELNTANLNSAKVLNQSDQQANTGNVTAEGNTTVGGLSSGNAQNSNSAKTSVSINNGNPLTPGAGGKVSGPVASSQPEAGSTAKGGSVLGAATGGLGGGSQAMLPEVGASVPVDVSALRAAWHAPVATLVTQTQGITGAMLLMATLLSVLGGVVSAMYGRRRDGRV
jgi:hypothetical protein